ncbi:formimidoylglutamate deiminase [Thalassotalea sediminis]|uniref:formimidoylglutamate deiminase n=1 Tax=Thalassotalea sediminis TaxID=1759089 RepID=UPI002574646D|nr:formimidoylglutamate deiminase [Thalassotalea sediminis]
MNIYGKNILLNTGWVEDKTLVIDDGTIVDIVDGKLPNAEALNIIIPGMINCHSHAFQRAFAGFSEQGSEGQDSFWTWRKVMYQFLAKLTDKDAEIIATQLYIEMLKMGYTRVAEFHYLHHNQQGNKYQSLATMARSIFCAAKNTGIGLTMLPVLYQYSGFSQQQPNDGQKRFINDVSQFNALVSECFDISKGIENTNVGIAPHSLRAVDKASLHYAVKHVRSLASDAPIHIHIAEQQKEVADCIAHYNKRPVQWLFDNIDVDQHWCLIHATHIDEQERKLMVEKGVIAGICPTTEANLGDGIFPTAEYVNEGGIFAIGSDSHISVNPVEELRWLEYAQRLIRQQRALLASTDVPSVGQYLWQKAAQGGAISTSSNTGELAIGKQADLLVLDDSQMRLFAKSRMHLLDSLVFASQKPSIEHVMVNGTWVIRDGQHPKQAQAEQQFAQLLDTVTA